MDGAPPDDVARSRGPKARIGLSAAIVVDLFRDGRPVAYDVDTGLPPNAEYVRSYYEALPEKSTDVLWVVYESPDLEIIEQGAKLPITRVQIVERRT